MTARSRLALALALAGALGAGALAGEKGGPLHVRVAEADGAVKEGIARLEKDAIAVETPGGLAKVPWAKIASLEEIDPEAPVASADPAHDREELEAREAELSAHAVADPRQAAAAWDKLAAWAHRRALAPEARRAWDKAVELEPDDVDARRGRGEARDEAGAWKPAGEVLAAREAKAGKTARELYELGRWAAKNGLEDEAISLVEPLAKRDAYDKALLSYLRPITDRRWQRTRLALPLRGRWKASADPTHHHEKKSFAVYAIDFYREVDGKSFAGEGKKLEDWYAWGAPIYAAADGEVVEVREGFPDNPINQSEGKAEKHNGVSILHEGGEATWYLHCQKGSIRVKRGQRVKKGELIARVGNSGGSAAPHLHFTMVLARAAISVPWRCDGYSLVTGDGTLVHVTRGHPVEGQTIEGEPEVPADAPGASR